MAMTSSRKALIGLAVVVIGYVGYSSMGSLPSASTISSQASGDRTAAQTFLQQAAQAEAALAEKDAFGARLAEVRTSVPPSPRLGDVITQLEQLSTAAGMNWVSGSTARRVNGAEGTWGMEMKVSGSPERLLTLVDAIQSMPRLVTIETVNLQAPAGADPTTVLSLRFYSTPGDLDAFPPEERAQIEAELEAIPAQDAEMEGATS